MVVRPLDHASFRSVGRFGRVMSGERGEHASLVVVDKHGVAVACLCSVSRKVMRAFCCVCALRAPAFLIS